MWRRRLKGKADDACRPAAGLVRVHVAEPAPAPDEDRFEVRARNGRSVLVPPGVDPCALATVVAAHRAMRTFGGHRVVLVVEPTDMRNSFHGLAGIASELLGVLPTSRDLLLFSHRGRNRLEILRYDASGTWVLAKRLERGSFSWPAGDTDTVEYRAEELALLLGGLDAGDLVSRKWRRRQHCAPIPSLHG